MTKIQENRYAISETTLERLEKMGWILEDLRPHGINRVKICENRSKSGKFNRVVPVGAIDYYDSCITPSNDFVLDLVIKAHAVVPGSPFH